MKHVGVAIYAVIFKICSKHFVFSFRYIFNLSFSNF